MMGDLMKTLTIIIAVLVVLTAGLVTARELSPLMTEINTALEETRQEVAALKLQYKAAVDEKEAMEIMREIARVKRESRVEMMRIQLRHARLAGNDELVLELEAIITKMTAPPVKGVPIPREANHQ